MQQQPKNQTYFSAGEAAKMVGKSKTTITRAIESGKISAEGGKGKPYKIQASELFRVYTKKGSATVKCNDTQPPIKQNVTLETANKINELETKVKLLNQKVDMQDNLLNDKNNQIEDIKNQRDKWEKQAEKVLITYQGVKPSNKNIIGLIILSIALLVSVMLYITFMV